MEVIGGHEPEGPETKRFKSLTTETDDDSARRLFPSGRRISTPTAHAAHLFGVRLGDRLGDHLETPGEQDGSKNMDFQRIWGPRFDDFLVSFVEQPDGLPKAAF